MKCISWRKSNLGCQGECIVYHSAITALFTVPSLKCSLHRCVMFTDQQSVAARKLLASIVFGYNFLLDWHSDFVIAICTNAISALMAKTSSSGDPGQDRQPDCTVRWFASRRNTESGRAAAEFFAFIHSRWFGWHCALFAEDRQLFTDRTIGRHDSRCSSLFCCSCCNEGKVYLQSKCIYYCDWTTV